MFTAPVLSRSAGTCRSYGAVIGVTTGPYKYPTPTELKTPVPLQVSPYSPLLVLVAADGRFVSVVNTFIQPAVTSDPSPRKFGRRFLQCWDICRRHSTHRRPSE